MPRRAQPGDRAALEAALTPTLRVALEELREVLDIRDWQTTPAGPLFSAAAVVLEAGRLVRSGSAPHTALCTAAARLGVEVDTVRARAVRWSVQHAHTGNGASATDLVRQTAAALTPELPK